MGYTHYWNCQEDCKVSKSTMSKIKKVIKHGVSKGVICQDSVIFSENNYSFEFNGVDKYEIFYVHFFTAFSFCKTAHRPYDAYVVACLILLERECQGFSWSSDGAEDDFTEGRNILKELKIIK